MAETRLPRLIDYHMHTGTTIDARMKEVEGCEQAMAQGIHEIAFTNHIMLNQPNYQISREACLVHWERIQECQQQYPALAIRLGLEMDYYPGREADIAETIRDYEALLGRPFDLVLGSIHELNGVFFSNKNHAPALYKDADLAWLYGEYFQAAAQAVRSGLFDIMAHPDLIKKYTYELNPPLAFAEYRASAEVYVDALLETGVGIEVNTKGLKLPVKEAYPSIELLQLYVGRARERGITPILTMGSDAHIAEDVGGCLLEAAGMLRGLGVTELSTFQSRKRHSWEL
jgi:histidinol-phosphatase (PHP family)